MLEEREAQKHFKTLIDESERASSTGTHYA